jgi:type I restriction enzyme S subunit
MSKEKTMANTIPIISNGIGNNAFYGYTDIAKITVPAVTVAARGTIGYAEYRDYPYFPIIRLLSVIPKDTSVVDTKYLYYCLQKKHYSIPMGGIPQLTAPELKKVKIPIFALSEQQRIVNILDRFDKLCNDISEGLPAEIEARRKQYEYYRDRLLSFKELKT